MHEGLHDSSKVLQLGSSQSRVLTHVCDLPSQIQWILVSQAQNTRTSHPAVQAGAMFDTTSSIPHPHLITLVDYTSRICNKLTSSFPTACPQGQMATTFFLECYLLNGLSSCMFLPVQLLLHGISIQNAYLIPSLPCLKYLNDFLHFLRVEMKILPHDL